MALRALIVAVMILGVVASTTVDRTVLLQDLVGNVTLERCEFLQNLSVGWEDVKNFTGSKRTILIEQNSWDSSRLSSHVFQILLTDVMGYNVEVKEFGGGVTTGRRLANTGIVDMAVELWPSDATEWYTMLVRSNRTVVDHGNIGYTGRVGLYIPAYLVDRYPDLYLDFWRFLRNPRATSIFPRSGTAPFAKDSTGSAVCDGVEAGCMNNTYAPSWYTPSSRSSFIEMLHVVPGYSQYVYERLIDGLRLNMTIQYMGDALEDYVKELYRKELPVLFYYWKPTTFIATHNFTRITFPDDSIGSYQAFETDRKKQSLSVDVPTDIIFKATSQQFAVEFKELLPFIQKVFINENDINEMLRNQKLQNWSTSQTACQWLSSHIVTWRPWLPAPPRAVPIIQFNGQEALRWALSGIAMLCSILTISCGVFMLLHINMKVFKASSPLFLGLMVVGAQLSFISIWVYAPYPMRTEICVLFSWLKYLGFSLVFGSLIIKTFRISIIFNQKQGKKASDVKINDSFLLLYLGAFLGIWVALLLAWTFIPGQRPRLKVGQVANVGEDGTFESILQTPICDFNAFNYGVLTVMVLTLISGIFITFRVKDTPSAFNESKWIAYALYNWVVIGVVLSGVSNFAVKDPDAVFVMEALTAIITQTGVIVLIFLPKIVTTLRGNGNAIEAIFRSGRSGSKDSEKTNGTKKNPVRSALAGDESENSGLVSGTSSQLRKKPSVAVSDQVVMYHAVAGSPADGNAESLLPIKTSNLPTTHRSVEDMDRVAKEAMILKEENRALKEEIRALVERK